MLSPNEAVNSEQTDASSLTWTTKKDQDGNESSQLSEKVAEEVDNSKSVSQLVGQQASSAVGKMNTGWKGLVLVLLFTLKVWI